MRVEHFGIRDWDERRQANRQPLKQAQQRGTRTSKSSATSSITLSQPFQPFDSFEQSGFIRSRTSGLVIPVASLRALLSAPPHPINLLPSALHYRIHYRTVHLLIVHLSAHLFRPHRLFDFIHTIHTLPLDPIALGGSQPHLIERELCH